MWIFLKFVHEMGSGSAFTILIREYFKRHNGLIVRVQLDSKWRGLIGYQLHVGGGRKNCYKWFWKADVLTISNLLKQIVCFQEGLILETSASSQNQELTRFDFKSETVFF